MFMHGRAIAVAGLAFLCLGAPSSAAALERLSSFAVFGKDSGQLSGPGGMDIAADGTIYVADTANNRVAVFAPNQNFIRAFGKDVKPSGGNVCTGATVCQQGAADASAGALSGPVDVSIAADGTVYVSDTANNRISVFAADGSFLRAFGKGVNLAGGDVCTAATGCQKGIRNEAPGALSSPMGIDADSAGTLYIASGENYRVDVFSPDGTFVRAFARAVGDSNTNVCTAASGCKKAKRGSEAGSFERPYGVAVGAGGQIAVSDSGNHRISVFDAKGEFVRAFGKGVTQAEDGDVCTAATKCRRGKDSGDAGAMDTPGGLALGSAGSLFVADTANNRIGEFSFDGTFIQAFGFGVLNGASALQTCTKETGCKVGIAGTAPGAVSSPSGTAVDCRGAIYALEGSKDSSLTRIERFGEAGTAPPPCTSAEEGSPPPSPPSPQTSQEPVFGPSPASKQDRAVMKPKITIELNGGSGTAVLSVLVADPGILTLRGKGIQKVKKRAKGPGLIELFVQPTGEALKRLQESGKATVKASLAFKPDKGAPITQVKAVALKMAAGF